MHGTKSDILVVFALSYYTAKCEPTCVLINIHIAGVYKKNKKGILPHENLIHHILISIFATYTGYIFAALVLVLNKRKQISVSFPLESAIPHANIS